MKTTYTPRCEPCTTCGRPVTRVRIYHDGTGAAHGELMQDYLRHADRAALGDRVDEHCNFSTEQSLLPVGGAAAGAWRGSGC